MKGRRMAQTSRTNRTRERPRRSAPAWVPSFLARLAETRNIKAACRAADVCRATVYVRRDKHPDFAAALRAALDRANRPRAGTGAVG